ncbi:MAG: hypothetical protein AAGD07_11825 [Planctomycetota bacterium]
MNLPHTPCALAVYLCFFASVMTQAESLVYEGEEGIGTGKHIVFIANDHEYRSEQSCPLLAKILAKHHGFKCTVLFGINDDGFIHPGAKNLPGMSALEDADLVFFFTRFMNLPDDQVQPLVDYLERGGPIVGVRTSTHCFNGQKGQWAKLNFNYKGDDYSGGLGKQVFGNTWEKERGQSHYGKNHVMGCSIVANAMAGDHPMLRGVGQVHAYSGAYKSQPPADATPLMDVLVLNTFGPSDERNDEKPPVCGAWTRSQYVAPSGNTRSARSVYASFGASEDMIDESTRRFYVNACLWSLGMEAVITPNLDVAIVGGYVPTPYNSQAFYYGSVRPEDLAAWDSVIMPDLKTLVGLDRSRNRQAVFQSRPEFLSRLVELELIAE